MASSHPFNKSSKDVSYLTELKEIRTSSGSVVTVLRKTMPVIAEALKSTVFYLYRDEQSALSSAKIGGTGVFVFLTSETGQEHLYAITNRHVIEKGMCPVIRVNDDSGNIRVIPLSMYDDWFYHPDGADIAAAYLPIIRDSLEVRAVPVADFVTEEMLARSGIDVGSDVYMLGRFIHHEGKNSNLPAARSGIISSMPNPGELIPVRDMQSQEAYLIEMRSLSGFSGSPTFYNLVGADTFILMELFMKVHFKIEPSKESEFDRSGSIVKLLGIDSGNFPMYEEVLERSEFGEFSETPYKAVNHSGFSIVIPAWKILETLERSEFEMARKQRDNQTAEGQARSDFMDEESVAFTKGDFESALKRASQKTSEPLQETKETSEPRQSDDCT